MSIYFTERGRDFLNDAVTRWWVSIVVVNDFGIKIWESERMPNLGEHAEGIPVPNPPEQGEHVVMARCWETRTSDEPLGDMYMFPIAYDAEDFAIHKGADVWVTLISPPPPPPEPSASDSD